MAHPDLEKSDPGESPALVHSDDGDIQEYKEGTRTSRFVDSFRRNPNARMVTQATDEQDRPLKDQPPAEPALAMTLKNRHLQMIGE